MKKILRGNSAASKTWNMVIPLKNMDASNWPMPAGPAGNWMVTAVHQAPKSFSAADGLNVLWKASLPEGGQSGIAVFNDRLFLSILKPAESEQTQHLKGADIIALCLDANDGSIIWEREMQGKVNCEYMSGFSDSSTPSPVTDGMHVWFTNASGLICCFDYSGNLVWERSWNPITQLDGVDFPFNKQFEPIIAGDTFVNMEPYVEKDNQRQTGWHYLVGLNKNTGQVKWISEDALTQYNTPFSNGLTVLIGRGGHHQVPESPKGFSMIDLATGKRIWRYETQEGTALYHSSFNAKYAVWLTESENAIHILNPRNGELIRKLSLTECCDVRRFDQERGQYILESGIDFLSAYKLNIFPAWFTNILVEDKLYFMCFKKGHYRKNIGPDYSLCKIDLKSGKVELLEVPTAQLPGGERVWSKDIETKTLNSRGLDVSHDKRSRRDGWHWNFNGNPICVNNLIYFTTMLGTVYSIDTAAQHFDESALVSVNDLGVLGETWSVNTPSFANGKLYHRTLQELICISEE